MVSVGRLALWSALTLPLPSASLKGERESQHVLVLDAALENGVGVVVQKVILHHGIHPKTEALITGERITKGARTQLHPPDAAGCKLGQPMAQQTGAYALALVIRPHGDIENFGRPRAQGPDDADPDQDALGPGGKTPGPWEV